MHPAVKHYQQVRNYTEHIFKPLAEEDYIAQPEEFVSPPKWSLGHTTWFFETFLLKPLQKSYREINSRYDILFNSYYNHVGEQAIRSKRGVISPSVEEVYAYRHHVDSAIPTLIKDKASEETGQLLELGLQHEQQHQELFWTDLKYTYGVNPQFPKYRGELPFTENGHEPAGEFHKVDEGIYEVGCAGNGFCYDNELKRHKVYLQNYEISKSLVTNQEYLDFMADGGYRNFDHWHDAGWKWVNEHQVIAPLHWHLRDGVWHQYTLEGLKVLDPSAPVTHVSYYEAAAFTNWMGVRLPTEFEWEVAAKSFNWGKRWEWTNSAYLPYPGFKRAPGAIGEYNGKFMVNQMVLRGASVATSPGHSRISYRNFFHPWERWQFTGIRIAR